jgi:hypothetical protein
VAVVEPQGQQPEHILKERDVSFRKIRY